jgi:phage-related minor tail protein
VKKETAEALEAIKNYSAEQRDETVKKVKQVMNELDREMERLEEKIDKKWDEMDEAARKNARETQKALRKQRNELAEWYGGIQHSSANAWDEVKRGFIKSYNTLEESFSEAAKKF